MKMTIQASKEHGLEKTRKSKWLNMIELKTLIPIVISSLALIVSFTTLYMTKIAPGKVRSIAGEHINIFYLKEGNIGVTLPVSFSNIGAKTVNIQRVALLFQSQNDKKSYLFEPVFYERLTEHGGFVPESQAAPIIIPTGKTVTKQVLFRSSIERQNEFQVRAVTYKLTLLVWIAGSVKPERTDSFYITLSDENIKFILEQYQLVKDNKPNVSFRTLQSKWRKWTAHYLTEDEVKDLQ
jgi:hypothetical protein